MIWRPSFNEQIEKNVTLNSRLAESVADDILETVSEARCHSERELAHLPKVLSLKVKKNIVKSWKL